MKTYGTATALVAALSVTSATASALQSRATSKTTPITIKGNAFYQGNTRFYIKGVDYQPGGSSDPVDPLANSQSCQRDVKEFIKLGINTLRVYTIDNSANHDDCMNALADAGIYLALDVNTPKYSIRQDKPAQSYNHVYLQNIFATIDEFQKYDNTLLFFSGNEVINNVPTSVTAPWIKAVTRDMKQYIGNRKYRSIPVGYSAADIDKNRLETAEYMNCGTDDARVDFFAFNDYSWCDPSDFVKSGWSKKVDAWSNYSIPLFLSEYGCIETTRKFQEVTTLYSDKMSSVYSGGLVYEYSVEGDATQSKYGLVDLTSGAEEQGDFSLLSDAFKQVKLPAGNGGAKTGGSASECPRKSPTWLVNGLGLPAMPPKASQYFANGAGKGVGFVGDGSQEVGAESTGTASAGSGQATATGTSGGSGGSGGSASSSAAATGLRIPEFSFAPLVCSLVVVASSLLGGAIML